VNTLELVLSLVHYGLGGNIQVSSRFFSTIHIKLVDTSQSHKHCKNMSSAPKHKQGANRPRRFRTTSVV
jgi:hypothetical protein